MPDIPFAPSESSWEEKKLIMVAGMELSFLGFLGWYFPRSTSIKEKGSGGITTTFMGNKKKGGKGTTLQRSMKNSCFSFPFPFYSLLFLVGTGGGGMAALRWMKRGEYKIDTPPSIIHREKSGGCAIKAIKQLGHTKEKRKTWKFKGNFHPLYWYFSTNQGRNKHLA